MILDQNKLNQKYFEAISMIPRESGNEKAVSDYVVSVAEGFGYKYIQDEMKNVIVFVPATEGYQDHEAVMLEAHMDMVCVKTSESTHDFNRDPLELYLDEEGNIRAKGTTLGADDGYGVAYMLALMEDKTPHPALELVFTVEEETGTYGAIGIDLSMLKSRRMIGLDTMGFTLENVSVVSCFTSDRIIAYKSLKKIPFENEGWLLTISGTEPLRKGSMVHPEEYNPVKIMARLLHRLESEDTEYYLSDIEGGTAENMYPLSCSALLYFPYELPMDVVTEELSAIQDELSDGVQHITLTVEKKPISSVCPDTEEVISFLYMLPSNTLAVDAEEHMVLTNMVGKIQMEGNKVIITMSSRAKTNALKHDLNEKMHLLCQMYGFQMDVSERYSSWEYRKDSFMRKKTKELMKSFLGKDMIESICPGGLEATCFIKKIPELDITMLAPIGENCHTVDEYLNLDSFDHMYDFLKKMLEEI